MARTTRRFRFLIALLIVLVSIFAFNQLTAQPPAVETVFTTQVIRIGIDPSYPPFAFYEDDELTGFEVELAQLLADDLNVEIQWIPLTFDGLYDALVTNRADMVLSALVVNPSRHHEVIYSFPYLNNGFVQVGASNHTVAFEFGSGASSIVERWSYDDPTLEKFPYELPIYALDAVRLGVSQSAVVEFVDYALYRQQYPDWSVSVKYVSVVPYVIATPQTRPDVTQLVHLALDNIQQNGTLRQLITDWFE